MNKQVLLLFLVLMFLGLVHSQALTVDGGNENDGNGGVDDGNQEGDDGNHEGDDGEGEEDPESYPCSEPEECLSIMDL